MALHVWLKGCDIVVPGHCLEPPERKPAKGTVLDVRLLPGGVSVAIVQVGKGDETRDVAIPVEQAIGYMQLQRGTRQREGCNSAPASTAVTGQLLPPKKRAAANSADGAKPARAKVPPKRRKGPPLTADLQQQVGSTSRWYGEPLRLVIEEASAVQGGPWGLGTPVWVRARGQGVWPAVTWSLRHCSHKDLVPLLQLYQPGQLLIRYYGTHSHAWISPEDVVGDCKDLSDKGPRPEALRAWGRANNKSKHVTCALDEWAGAEVDSGAAEVARMVAVFEHANDNSARMDDVCWHHCYCCKDYTGMLLSCVHCQRPFHPMCMNPPALTHADLVDCRWSCPCCGGVNKMTVGPDGSPEDNHVERMGLTPDWIIQAAAFEVFGLMEPIPGRPYIQGLLDPCTNSRIAPNIPAEKLYDKADDGLKLSNSWKGYYVVLNPDYSASIQWRFVNRAIDEVENGEVPGIVLVCRNSTDTAYFQRLRPYPRVLLRRTSCRFKDYSNTPIGFGIVVFCIAKPKEGASLYLRFMDSFSPYGEPNIPIDKHFMASGEFLALLRRLHQHSEEWHRDHWVKCCQCSQWRNFPYKQLQAVRSKDDWACSDMGPGISCSTPMSRIEEAGVRYAVRGDEAHGLPPTAADVAGNDTTAAVANSDHNHAAGQQQQQGAEQQQKAETMAGVSRATAAAALPAAVIGQSPWVQSAAGLGLASNVSMAVANDVSMVPMVAHLPQQQQQQAALARLQQQLQLPHVQQLLAQQQQAAALHWHWQQQQMHGQQSSTHQLHITLQRPQQHLHSQQLCAQLQQQLGQQSGQRQQHTSGSSQARVESSSAASACAPPPTAAATAAAACPPPGASTSVPAPVAATPMVRTVGATEAVAMAALPRGAGAAIRARVHQQRQQHQKGLETEENGEGREGGEGQDDDEDDDWIYRPEAGNSRPEYRPDKQWRELVPSLELSRQAQIAANRSFLAYLGMGPGDERANKALGPGPASNPMLRHQARCVGLQTAVDAAEKQLADTKSLAEFRRQRRKRREKQLQRARDQLLEEEAEDAKRLVDAADTHRDLTGRLRALKQREAFTLDW